MEYRQYQNLTETYLNEVNEDTKQNLNENVLNALKQIQQIRKIRAAQALRAAAAAEGAEGTAQIGRIAVDAARGTMGEPPSTLDKILDFTGDTVGTFYNAAGDILTPVVELIDLHLGPLGEYLGDRLTDEDGNYYNEPNYAAIMAAIGMSPEDFDNPDFGGDGDGIVDAEEQETYEQERQRYIELTRQMRMPDLFNRTQYFDDEEELDDSDLFRDYGQLPAGIGG